MQDRSGPLLEAGEEEDSLSVMDDELDSHDCMLPLVHLIEKAAALFEASHAHPGGMMPEWMKRMHDAVGSGEVPSYARLFLVKVVLHVDRRHAERQNPEEVCPLHRSPDCHYAWVRCCASARVTCLRKPTSHLARAWQP